MKSTITCLLLLFFGCSYSQETPPVNLTLSASFTVVNSQVARFNGTEKGCINVQLRGNGTFVWTTEGGPLGKSSSVFGSYTLHADKIKFSYDNGTIQEFTIIKMDDIITKMIAGERALYFVRSRSI